MQDGLLKDYVTHTQLLDNDTINTLAEQIMEASGVSASITSIASAQAELKGQLNNISSFISTWAGLQGILDELRDNIGTSINEAFGDLNSKIIAGWLAGVEWDGDLKSYMGQFLTSNGDTVTGIQTDIIDL